MRVWELIAQLCKAVVDNGNVYLEIFIDETGMRLMLMPLGDELEEGE